MSDLSALRMLRDSGCRSRINKKYRVWQMPCPVSDISEKAAQGDTEKNELISGR